MKVSLCMIVKDAEKTVEASLASVSPLVDEIVIVDTGSSDGTKEITQEYANIYEEIEWNGFANARNRAQELATGDAILVLDADERITQFEGWKKGLELLEEGSDGICFLLHNRLPPGQLLTADRMWQIRMFMKSPYAKWAGKVHNQISNSLKDNPRNGEEAQFHQVQVVIDHVGYALSPEELESKYRKRLPDLLWELENAVDEGVRAYYHFQTSNTYFMLKERDKSLEHAMACEIEWLTEENRYSLSLMAVHSCHLLGKHEEAEEWSWKMMKQWPQEVMSFLMVGLALLDKKNYQGAYQYLGACLAHLQLKGMSWRYLLDAEYIAGATGEAALALGRYGEAKALFQMHLSKHNTSRIAELESKIIPVEKAREGALVDSNGRPLGEIKRSISAVANPQ